MRCLFRKTGLSKQVEKLYQARLAQSVERQALNLVVGGSSPPVGDSFDSYLFIHPKTLFSAVEQCFLFESTVMV